MLNSGHDLMRHLIGSCNQHVYPKFMKFLVAPESNNAIDLALFVMDHV